MIPNRFRRSALALAALALAATTQPALAVDYVWNGSDGLWTDANRWNGLGVPGAGDSASIAGTGTGSVRVMQATSVGALSLNTGVLGGSGTLTAASFNFAGGRLGASSAAGGGTLVVTGRTDIFGAVQLGLDYSHTLQLGSQTFWTQGNGILGVQPGYTAGNTAYPTSSLRIVANSQFNDLGAADAAGSKNLGYYGGAVVNEGTYTRTGLGSTLARGFDNRGTLNIQQGTFAFTGGNADNTSSGTIRVSGGATLVLGNATLTAGSVLNSGRVVLSDGSVNVAAGVAIGGAWQIDGHVQYATITGNHTLQSLTLNDGFLSPVAGAVVVNGPLVFNAGTLGHSGATAFGELIANGSTTFNGSAIQTLDYSKRLRLVGNATWSAGNGSIAVQPAYTAGTTTFQGSELLINTTSTFTDLGAATASGSKQLGYYGGFITNSGLYVRQGLGTTVARNFLNQSGGVLRVDSGTFAMSGQLFRGGTVQLAAGAVLAAATDTPMSNGGLIAGNGTVRAFNHATNSGLSNFGTLDPGSAGAAGTLTIDGALRMEAGSVLHIDLYGSDSDRLVVVDGITFGGELALSGAVGRDGSSTDASSFVVASYGQRLANSSFSRITWNGQETTDVTLTYGATGLTVQISAVPEPAQWLLLATGIAALAQRSKTRRPAGAPLTS